MAVGFCGEVDGYWGTLGKVQATGDEAWHREATCKLLRLPSEFCSRVVRVVAQTYLVLVKALKTNVNHVDS
jgi:hypothetical protein